MEISAWRYKVQPHIIGFAEFWEWKDKKVLEIGCGIGTDTLEFQKAGARIAACDISFTSVSIANRRCTGVSFYSGNVEDRLPDGSFDLIWSFGVLHHTPHPEKVLRLARQRIADTGELRIMLYARWSLKHLLREQPEAQAGCPIVRWYSAKSARRLVESCGWRVTSIEKTHIFPWKVSEYRQHRLVKRWPYRIMPRWTFTYLESILGHHLLVRAVPA
jgi:SAM-dependent methyltransferase